MVLLVGYFGHGNIGDDATLKIISERLSRENIDYRVFGYGKHAAFSVTSISSAIRKSSAVIFPAGNVLQNESGTPSLFYYLKIIKEAYKNKIPVLFISCGIGKIQGVRLNALTKKILGGVSFFGARTSLDFDAVRLCGIRESRLIPDLAFCLRNEAPRRARKSALAYIVKDGSRIMLDKLEKIKRNTGISITVIPLFYKEDFGAARRAAEILDAPISVPYDEKTLVSELSGFSFSVCERLHGAVFSMIAETPAFLPDDLGKCSAFYREIKKRTKDMAQSPVMVFDELCVKKAIELEAQDSEFEKILNELRCDTEAGLSYFINRLSCSIGEAN